MWSPLVILPAWHRDVSFIREVSHLSLVHFVGPKENKSAAICVHNDLLQTDHEVELWTYMDYQVSHSLDDMVFCRFVDSPKKIKTKCFPVSDSRTCSTSLLLHLSSLLSQRAHQQIVGYKHYCVMKRSRQLEIRQKQLSHYNVIKFLVLFSIMAAFWCG